MCIELCWSVYLYVCCICITFYWIVDLFQFMWWMTIFKINLDLCDNLNFEFKITIKWHLDLNLPTVTIWLHQWQLDYLSDNSKDFQCDNSNFGFNVTIQWQLDLTLQTVTIYKSVKFKLFQWQFKVF